MSNYGMDIYNTGVQRATETRATLDKLVSQQQPVSIFTEQPTGTNQGGLQQGGMDQQGPMAMMMQMFQLIMEMFAQLSGQQEQPEVADPIKDPKVPVDKEPEEKPKSGFQTLLSGIGDVIKAPFKIVGGAVETVGDIAKGVVDVGSGLVKGAVDIVTAPFKWLGGLFS